MGLILGAAAATYIGSEPIGKGIGATLPALAKDANGVTWSLYDNIMDATANFDADSEDVTTRAEARNGFQSTIFGPAKGEVSFDARFDTDDVLLDKLIEAWLKRTQISILDLSELKTVNGAMGLVANFYVSFSGTKPIKSAQRYSIKLVTSQFTDWVTSNGTVLAKAFP